MSKVQCWLLANDSACWHGSQLFPFSFFHWRRILHAMTQIRYGSDQMCVGAARLGIQDGLFYSESHRYLTLSSRGLVFHDRLNTLERRPRPKSLRRASLRSRFSMWASCSAQQARTINSRISRQTFTLLGRGLVRWDRADALERWPEPKSIRRASLRSRFRRRASTPGEQGSLSKIVQNS